MNWSALKFLLHGDRLNQTPLFTRKFNDDRNYILHKALFLYGHNCHDCAANVQKKELEKNGNVIKNLAATNWLLFPALATSYRDRPGSILTTLACDKRRARDNCDLMATGLQTRTITNE